MAKVEEADFGRLAGELKELRDSSSPGLLQAIGRSLGLHKSSAVVEMDLLGSKKIGKRARKRAAKYTKKQIRQMRDHLRQLSKDAEDKLVEAVLASLQTP